MQKAADSVCSARAAAGLRSDDALEPPLRRPRAAVKIDTGVLGRLGLFCWLIFAQNSIFSLELHSALAVFVVVVSVVLSIYATLRGALPRPSARVQFLSLGI